MAAISDNKYDVFEWIKKVMYSCKDNPQLQSSLTLPSIFLNKYDDYILYSELNIYWSTCYDTLADRKLKQLIKD